MIFAIPLLGFYRVNKIKPTDKSIEVVIVQPNIDPNKKWDYSLREQTMNLMDSLYKDAIAMKPDLIIFPETALPSYLKIETIIRKRLQKKVNELEVALSAIEITELRLLSALENGGHPGAESSILKIKGTEMQQALSELFVEASGEYALMYPGPHGYENNDKPAGPDYAAEGLSGFLNLRKTSIYGGSNEIQKNILSKFVLGV